MDNVNKCVATFISVADSPRLGPNAEQYGRIIISANDNANGILSLSSPAVQVSEETTQPLIYVVRSGGAYGEVRFYCHPYVGHVTSGPMIGFFSCIWRF